MTPAELLAQWRAMIAAYRAAGRTIQAQVRSEDADALELALAGGHYADCHKCGLALSHGMFDDTKESEGNDDGPHDSL